MGYKHLSTPFLVLVAFMATLSVSCVAQAQESSPLSGSWIVNAELSDNTDKQVERALRDMGQKVSRCWLGCKEDRFRGGPKEQELYDRISYDKTLTIEQVESGYRFVYDDDYLRQVYTDGRRQSVSLQGLDQLEDFSFGHWERNRLLVEARPRDGGFANETYTLIENGTRLRAELYIKPRTFTQEVNIIRIYDRIAAASQ